MIVDEAEVDLTQRGGEINNGMPIRLPKRKPGPLPKDYVFVPRKNRPTNPNTPNPSPQPANPIVEEVFQPQKVESVEEIKKMPVVDFESESEGYVGLFGEDMSMDFETPMVAQNQSPPQNNPPVLEIPELEEEPILPPLPPLPPPPQEIIPEPIPMDTNNVAETPIRPIVVEDEESIHRNNFNIRVELHKEIRRPRVRIGVLLKHLKCLSGSKDTKLKFVKNLEREAMRFRRKKIANLFKEQIQSMGSVNV